MEKMQFSVSINAPVDKVFDNMLGSETYKQWTSAFDPSSNYEGTWAQGKEISFTAIGKDGKRGGMLGLIESYKPNEYISIRYTGLIDGDQQIKEGEQTKSWIGNHENYTFNSLGNQTTVTVDLDVDDPYINYFKETYPIALNKLKQISEVA